ncbi:hypothetical protein Ahy_A07g036256 isoform A [Arachis hypogaea]|uniref:Protein kinase domain-containing protein n=1 Tax=Arachis hypogaea TaxID=3818 RepID=A0A445CFP6_ARAHY|nr:hypothetical protein Ahy_A07g036256 isoform A [Arachis hypogaea]
MPTLLIIIVVLISNSCATSALNNFTPKDNFLIDCGAEKVATLPDGRRFKSESESSSFLQATDDTKVSSNEPIPKLPSPIYSNARIFIHQATYSFPLSHPGFHWLRLHFYPIENTIFELHKATFSVNTDKYVLLHSFNVNNDTTIVKEFLINATEPHLSIFFIPTKDSAAFINAIELVSAPDNLIFDTATSLFPVGDFSGLSNYAFQTAHRINNGGPLITSSNDTLGRTWVSDSDAPYLTNKNSAKSVSVATTAIKFPSNTPTISPLIAPQTVYASAMEMGDAGVNEPNFNVSWKFDVDTAFDYLVRLHFCDIVSKGLNELYFSVYVNGKMAVPNLDLSAITGALATPYYKDIVINASLMSEGLMVQVGPANAEGGNGNAIMNGIEVLKISNSVDSLDGEFGVDGRKAGGSNRAMGLGRFFSFAELQDATKSFDSNNIIGVGGFGNVYLGVIDEGTKVAVKRGNPQSEQGINEFQTEIQMLSKLRHRHLVSLIGYCDENNEMILVYEYMPNGHFREHLYGKNLPPLSWKQRLEICIGAARGLHYLHTGTTQGIIHRDVKTTNILLDENFTAKVSDFGLSKDAPMGQGHVSTAVKGSFGYLDPEYFRRQQLTEKSDVYSFGVVLLEALCARAAINPQLPREQVNLADWAMQWKRKGMLEKIVDPHLIGSLNAESMKKFAEAAEKCLADHGVDRPTMGDVLWNLEYALQLQDAFTQGKVEDLSNSSASVPTPPTLPNHSSISNPASVDDNNAASELPHQEVNNNNGSTQVPATEDYSGTMFSQVNNLSGR